MRTQLKAGDLVRLKKNLRLGEIYGGIKMLGAMKFDGHKNIDEVCMNSNVLLKSWPFYYSPIMLIKEKGEYL